RDLRERAAPGRIWTNLVRHLPEDQRESLRTDPRFEYKTPEQGAATSVFVATTSLLDEMGRRYFEGCDQALLPRRRPGACRRRRLCPSSRGGTASLGHVGSRHRQLRFLARAVSHAVGVQDRLGERLGRLLRNVAADALPRRVGVGSSELPAVSGAI